MSTTIDLERFIVTELARGLGIEAIAPDEDLLATGLVDSHGVVELVGFIESEYGLTVLDDDLTPEHFSTLATIAAYIDSRREA